MAVLEFYCNQLPPTEMPVMENRLIQWYMQIPGGSFIMIMYITIMNKMSSNITGASPTLLLFKIFSQNINIFMIFRTKFNYFTDYFSIIAIKDIVSLF